MSENYQARFVTEPVVACIADMKIDYDGTDAVVEWARSRAPACLPDDFTEFDTPYVRFRKLFPHDLTDGRPHDSRSVTDNELLVELAGRKCYNSYGRKAGRKSNAEYILHTQEGDPPHRSITYHAKMTFFIAGVSRRVSHELIRNYVGADRDEEGAPSQESTRYVPHNGFMVIHPRYLDGGPGWRESHFRDAMEVNYHNYRQMIDSEIRAHEEDEGATPKGTPYKRILEAGSSLLSHSAETSWVWTTNPAALANLFKQRDHDAADLEFRRLARAWKKLCMARWPNLFPQPWMQETK